MDTFVVDVWIAVALRRDFFAASMDRRNDYSVQASPGEIDMGKLGFSNLLALITETSFLFKESALTVTLTVQRPLGLSCSCSSVQCNSYHFTSLKFISILSSIHMTHIIALQFTYPTSLQFQFN